MSKTLNARIKNKRDTSANWTAQDPVLLNGEIIVVDTASGEMRFKIGDGTKRYSQLPFQDEILRNSKADLEAGVYTATASSTDGVSYTATVTGIDSLSAGSSFIMIPNKTSASTTPTLNVNGLGAKTIKRRLSSISTSVQSGYSNTWISVNKPFTVVYDGTYWIVEGLTQPAGADVYGAVPKAKADENGNVFADTYATIAAVNESKSLGLTSAEVGQTIVVKAVDENGKPTEWEATAMPSGGAGNMKKLTFTGAVTGEYDGTTDVNIDIPIATTSTAGTIKVGNGLSISADGTLSVTTATYYTGTADPVNTLGADGDLYLKTEG